ncbi:type I restriction endonuclease, partial [Vibrio parahaemolyticus]|nr:type I restriction endonuclease [Vibrio parahaemolyticus]
FKTQHKEALDGLKVARALSIWFHQSFGKQGTAFKAGPFVPPSDPSSDLRLLQSEIEKLKAELTQANVELDSSKQFNDLINREKAEYEALALAMDEESKQLSEQAKAHEQALSQQQKEYESKLQDLQKQLEQQGEKAAAAQKQQVSSNTRSASQQIVLSEELTRILIDQQLIEAGWSADSQEQTFKNGARPEKCVNKAIAEWPTKHNGKGGRADYVLFHGLTPIAVVEAKK